MRVWTYEHVSEVACQCVIVCVQGCGVICERVGLYTLQGCAQMHQGPHVGLAAPVTCLPLPRGPAGQRGSEHDRRGSGCSRRARPRALFLAQEHPRFPIPGKEHNVHWRLSCLTSPTPRLPRAARHFRTRTASIQGAKTPGAEWEGDAPAPRVSATGDPPRHDERNPHSFSWPLPCASPTQSFSQE